MRISQYAHFLVGSDVFDPDDITGTLLLEPTSVSWRGTCSSDPMIPRSNLWQYRARGEGTIDELVRELVDVFEPLADKLAALTADHSTWISISVFRSFDGPEGVEEDSGPDDLPPNLIRLEGQHQLVGFHLEPALMRRLVDINCPIDVDEYA
jgi:Domain of unknown function (DUF4279)